MICPLLHWTLPILLTGGVGQGTHAPHWNPPPLKLSETVTEALVTAEPVLQSCRQ